MMIFSSNNYLSYERGSSKALQQNTKRFMWKDLKQITKQGYPIIVKWIVPKNIMNYVQDGE